MANNTEQISSLKDEKAALTLQLCKIELDNKISINTENISDNADAIKEMKGRHDPPPGSLDSPIASTRNANIRNAGLMAGGGGLIALMIEIMKVILKAIGG